jgi:hypothetical protein
MPNKPTLRILNPILAVLMASQLLSGVCRSHVSPETFTWLHVRGGVALMVALAFHLTANWDWVRSLGRPSHPSTRSPKDSRSGGRSLPDAQAGTVAQDQPAVIQAQSFKRVVADEQVPIKIGVVNRRTDVSRSGNPQ